MRIQKINIDGQTEILIDRIDTVAYLLKEVFGYEKFVCVTGQIWNPTLITNPFFDFLQLKFYDGETSFSSQNYFSQADIGYQSKAVLFD